MGHTWASKFHISIYIYFTVGHSDRNKGGYPIGRGWYSTLARLYLCRGWINTPTGRWPWLLPHLTLLAELSTSNRPMEKAWRATFLSLCWAFHQSNVFTKTPVEVSWKKLGGWPWLQSRDEIWGNAPENIFIYSMAFEIVGKGMQLKEEKTTFTESLLHLGPCLLAF